MTSGAADGLYQRPFGAQEAFLVGVENGDQRHFRDIEAFAQQVDAHQHVELAQTQVADNFDPLDGIDIRMQISDLDPVLVQIVGQVLGHPLGQRRNQHAFVLGRAQIDLGEQVIDLRLRLTHLEHGVDQPGRSHELLHHLPRMLVLVVGRRRRNENRLRKELLELIEAQRAVVQRGRQPEAVVDQVLLARAIALVHPADLRNRHVRFIDKRQGFGRQIVDERGRRLAGGPSR